MLFGTLQSNGVCFLHAHACMRGNWRCCSLHGIRPATFNQLSGINAKHGGEQPSLSLQINICGATLRLAQTFSFSHTHTHTHTHRLAQACTIAFAYTHTHAHTHAYTPVAHLAIQKVTSLSITVFCLAETNASAPCGFPDKQISLSLGKDDKRSPLLSQRLMGNGVASAAGAREEATLPHLHAAPLKPANVTSTKACKLQPGVAF